MKKKKDKEIIFECDGFGNLMRNQDTQKYTITLINPEKVSGLIYPIISQRGDELS